MAELPSETLGLWETSLSLFIEEPRGEALLDDALGERAGVDEVIGVVAIISKFVEYQFVGGEVEAVLWVEAGKLLGEEEKGSLAEGIAMGSVSEVAHRAYGLHYDEIGEPLT